MHTRRVRVLGVLWLQRLDVAAVLALPWALCANVIGDDFVEGAVPADYEDVIVGDGTKGLVARLVHFCSPPL